MSMVTLASPSPERNDLRAAKAAMKIGWPKLISLLCLKLPISEKFRVSKDEWHVDPEHHGSKESCPDGAGNGIARCAARIRYWRWAEYMKRITKRQGNKWRGRNRLVRLHCHIQCYNDRSRIARAEAREGKDPGRVLPVNQGWKSRFLGFLGFSGWRERPRTMLA
jgi:hypothetical protein